MTANGNGSRLSQARTPAIGAADTTSYGYDAANSLASVELPSGTNVGYTSDGDGLRQSRTVDSSTQAFVWNVNAAIALLLDDGEHRYVYGPTSTPIAQYDASDGVEYLLTDQLGSVRVVTDAVGAIVGSASFGVFGAVEGASGVASAFGFTGAWTDDETGLVYLRARDYDPATGQFLQVDPAVDDTRQPYAYAYNNPLLWTDPTGLDVWGDIGNGVLGFAAGVLDDLTFGASSAILGAVVPGYACWTQTNPWFGVGQTVSMVVTTALLVVSGVGAAFAIAKVVATIGMKAAVKLAAATIKATARNALQSAKSVLAAGRGATEAAQVANQVLRAAKTVPGPNNALRDVASGRFASNPAKAQAPVANSAHGNSRSSEAVTHLYRLEDANGNLLKWGITSNLGSRYSLGFLSDKQLLPMTSGTRDHILNLERWIVERDPGPLNFEPWAGVKA